MMLGNFCVFVRPGSWCRPSEWVFARQECDEGCLVWIIGWVWVEWRRGGHAGETERSER